LFDRFNMLRCEPPRNALGISVFAFRLAEERVEYRTAEPANNHATDQRKHAERAVPEQDFAGFIPRHRQPLVEKFILAARLSSYAACRAAKFVQRRESDHQIELAATVLDVNELRIK
jgi:hypothetical protein